MHLAILQHTDLLPRSCQPLLTLPQVSEAVVTQGRERPLARASVQSRVSAVMFTSFSPQGSLWIHRATSPARRSSSP